MLADCVDKLKSSLFMVGEIGSNDYNYALSQGKSMEEVKAMVPDVVAAIKEATKVKLFFNKTMLYVYNMLSFISEHFAFSVDSNRLWW